METAVLTEYDMKHCISSSRYHICHETIATETGHRSCLALLFLDALLFALYLDALRACATEKLQLPATEKAENLGYGVWLIISASAAIVSL